MNPGTTLSLDDRRAGFLAGAVIGSALAARTADKPDATAIARALAADPLPLAPPLGRRPAGTALADALLEELLGGGVDLQRLSRRWVEWWRSDGLDADPVLIEALAHLQQFDAPVERLEGGTAVILAATLPAALAASSPGSMVAGTFHTARLLDPDPVTGLAAVAVVMAAARSLEGQRDFIGEVLTMLRTNGAPEAFYEAMRSVPRDPRTPPPTPFGPTATAVAAAPWLLWQLHHRPRGEEILREMVVRGGVASSVGAVLGALVGARDGLRHWPREWAEGAGEDVALRLSLAARLAADQGSP
ncbi:MAG TPA: ADP-ribosylglycohydrolase family protein [Gemmatimonadales bacterium]|nr:ADP-ribosylglycohydrolase family protein [Gemmatimonadales bacterium]